LNIAFNWFQSLFLYLAGINEGITIMTDSTKTIKKKNNKSEILKSWNSYEFGLRVPATINKDNKIEVLFTFIDPITKKGKQIKRSTDINRYADKDTYTKQAKDLIESLIDLLEAGWNPITNKIPEKSDRLTEKSTIEMCLAYWKRQRTIDFDSGKIQKGELGLSNRVLELFQAYLKHFNLTNEKPGFFTVNDVNKFMRYIEPDTQKLIKKVIPESKLGVKKEEKPTPLAKTTYNSYLYRLSFFFEFLITERLIVFNPTRGAHKYQTKNLKTKYTIYENDELETVRACLNEEDRFKDLLIGIHLLYSYRIRAKEQYRIKVGWFDFEDNSLQIPEEVIERNRKIKATKNGNSASFSISPKVMDLIKDYLGDNIHSAEYFLFGGKKQKYESYFSNKFKNMLIKYNLPLHLKFYALKHTSNYNSYETLGIEALSKINRHSNISQTQDYIKSKLRKEIITINPDTEF
jgi:site-specific recombinase XerD